MNQPEHTTAQPATTPTTGTTTITDTAAAKVAAGAARNVVGVHSLGVGSNRALGALRGAVGAGEVAQGVAAEIGQAEVAVDITLTAEHGRPLQQIAEEVRAAVYAAVEELTGLHVIEVNIEIADVRAPEIPGTAAVGPAVPEMPSRAPTTGTASIDGPDTPERMEER